MNCSDNGWNDQNDGQFFMELKNTNEEACIEIRTELNQISFEPKIFDSRSYTHKNDALNLLH